MAHDPFRLGLNSNGNIFSSVLPLLDRICPEQAVITKIGDNLKRFRFGKTHHTKVVNVFDTFPASIITPSSDKWSKSNDLWKSGVRLEIPAF
jgi:hypothetical protein